MTLQPNEEMIRDYLELIHGAYGDLSAIMAIRCLKDDKAIEQRFPLLELDAAVEWVASHNKAVWNTYVTHARVKPRIKGKFVCDDDIAEGAWLVADADDPDALENIKNYSTPPQILLLTGQGRGWGAWPVDNNATNASTFKKRQVQLVKELRTDPAVTNFSRIIPIAGTVRYQPESKRAKGYEDGLITFEFTPHPPLDTGRLANPTAKVLYLNQASGMTISDAHEKLREIKDGNRHEPMLQGAIALRENGLRDDQILEALEPHANPDNPQEPRDIQKWVSQNIQPNRPPSNEAQPEKPLPEFDLQRFGGSLAEPAICYSAIFQVSPEMAFIAVLGAAAIATQHLGNVEHFNRYVDPRPLNLFLLLVAKSGERKTALFNAVTKPIRLFEKQRMVDHQAQQREHNLEVQMFEQRERERVKKHKNAEARADLLAEKPPEPPEGKRMIFGADSSPPALQKLMQYNQPSIAKVEPEGGIYFKGYAKERSIKDATHAFENAAWDGICPASERVTRESTPEKEMRFTMLIASQPDPVQDMLNDPTTKDMGTLARWLISMPPSRIGTRFFRDEEISTEPKDNFETRLLECLQIDPTLKDGGLTLVGRQQMPSKLELPTLKLSAKAREQFIQFYDDIERRLVGDLSGHGDVGSKAAEQALRIAGVMTFYENPHAKEVPDNIAASAIALTDYFVGQNIKLTGGGISQKRLAELKDHVAERWGDEPFYLAQAQQFWKGSRRKSDVLMDLSKLVDNGYLEQLPPTEIDGTLRQSVWKVLP